MNKISSGLGGAIRGALRDIRRNRIDAVISIVGLAVGLAATLLTILFIRADLRFDSFIPDNQRIYVLTSSVRAPGQDPVTMDSAPSRAGAFVKQNFGQVREQARLAYDNLSVKANETEAREDVAWVDASFFSILKLPAEAGSPSDALKDPSAIVITNGMARKYFGRPNVVGETLRLGGTPYRVAAVLRDFPPETHLSQQLFGSARAPTSPLRAMDDSKFGMAFYNFIITHTPGAIPENGLRFIRVRTYLKVSEGVDELARTLPTLEAPFKIPPGSSYEFGIVRLDQLHLSPVRGSNLGAEDLRTTPATLYALAVVALLVLSLAIINFINLKTARSAARAVEVGVRKSVGAQRWQVGRQFIGESMVQAAMAAVLALALSYLLLPSLNAFLTRGMSLPPLESLAFFIIATLVIGGLAGLYPAAVLSAWRPAVALKGGALRGGGSSIVRQILVVFQFAVLVVFIVGVAVVTSQTQFAMRQGMQMDDGGMLIIRTTPCRGAFQTEVQRIPGVEGAGCSSETMLGLTDLNPSGGDVTAQTPGGQPARLSMGLVDFGLFDLYGIEPLAGRVFSRSTPSDELPAMEEGVPRRGQMVINESAARRLGFPDPAKAINAALSHDESPDDQFVIVGVVPDFTVNLVSTSVKPTAYIIDFASYPLQQVMSVKIANADRSQTLRAIDERWKATGHQEAMDREFLTDHVRRVNTGLLRQAFLVTCLCALALLLGCLGLLGLAAFMAERRTQEMGVRKAMGASKGDVVRLMLWSFTLPVLAANLIALPVAYVIASRWLGQFSYRIELNPMIFVGAFAASLLVAWLTVLGHARLVAGTSPMRALRYE